LDVEERRAQLVELGLQTFASRTYDEVSIEDVARAAGISKGLLFHYFPTKRAYFVACLRESTKRLLAHMEGVAAPPGSPPIEHLKLALDAYLDYVRARGRAYTALMRSTVSVDPEIAEVVDRTRATLLATLTGGISEVFPTAKTSPILDLALTGWIGLAETMSIAWVERADGDVSHTGAPSRTEVRDVLVTALVALVGTATG
jgi:AcrR family transcriptional regulator